MSHRTQITLTDHQYLMLKQESSFSGVSIAELVRRAISYQYGKACEDSVQVLQQTAGAWANDRENGAAYVDRLRPGIGARLARRVDDRSS
jgi:hypothetical protein